LTGAILEVVDDNERDGLGHRRVKIEGMAWDPESGRMVAFNDYSNHFVELTLEDGNNSNLGEVRVSKKRRLTDVEGIDFLLPVPVPATLWLTLLGLVPFMLVRHRQNRLHPAH